MKLRVTVLGCGTSTGVPRVGCACAVCRSDDPRNKRLRSGLSLAYGGHTVLVDTPTDLRQQALREALSRVDAVLYTHAHADHIMGLDELRVLGPRGRPVPCFGSESTLASLRRSFAYVFEDGQEGGGKPRLSLHPIDGPFDLFGATVVPVPVLHGALEVLGYRIGGFAYLTDCNHVPSSSLALLDGLDVLILDALRYRPHPTHFSIAEALEVAAQVGARRTLLTHLTHDVDYRRPEVALPANVELSYDGLTLDLD